MDPQSPHFGCFTLQKTISPGSIFISGVGLDGETNRRRKAHTKSRRGCKNCKVRKIKCDEETPCRNCVRRNQECNNFIAPPILLSSIGQSQPPPIQEMSGLSCVIPDPPSSAINLEHLRLLHHFQNFTFETFVMEPKTWKDTVMALALQNPFLMHIVFLVTATHLQHLQPHEQRRHQLVALENLSHALPQFRETLGSVANLEKPCGKALIVCSMLLLQYSWTYNSEGWKSLEAFYRGMTSIVLKFIEGMDVDERDPFTSMLVYSPRLHIENYFENTPVSSDLEDTFAHILACTKISHTQPDNLNDFIEPLKRLTTILSSLSLGWRKIQASGLTLAVARYLFSWPNLLPNGFISMLKEEEGRVLIIMLYYFAAVSRLPTERFWWMKERGKYMYERILQSTGDKCTECTSYGIAIFEARDLD